MPETHRLFPLVMQRLREGSLPSRTETTALGGFSRGARCGLCDGDVEPGAPDIELEWSEAGEPRSVVLHPACHAAWLAVARHGEERAAG